MTGTDIQCPIEMHTIALGGDPDDGHLSPSCPNPRQGCLKVQTYIQVPIYTDNVKDFPMLDAQVVVKPY